MVYLHGKQNPVRADSLNVSDVLRGDHYTGLTVTRIAKKIRNFQVKYSRRDYQI